MGPLEYAVFRFQGNEFNGEILPALGRLVDSGTIAVLDLLFITKDADGKACLGRAPGPSGRRRRD